jgi:transcriptional regulator NrdR family protein
MDEMTEPVRHNFKHCETPMLIVDSRMRNGKRHRRYKCEVCHNRFSSMECLVSDMDSWAENVTNEQLLQELINRTEWKTDN